MTVRVAVVAESFVPRVNGVTNSVCRVLEHLASCGHEALVIAPAPGPRRYAGFPVHLIPGVPVPGYASFRMGLPSRRVGAILRNFGPDLVHLASPVVLGASGAAAAGRLNLPAIAVFQTDLAGFARRYGLGRADPAIWRWLRWVHGRAARTPVPSSESLKMLAAHGIPRLALWRRGVDLERFNPAHRATGLRERLAPRGEVIVGYVGRIATEKRVHLLAHLADLPGIR